MIRTAALVFTCILLTVLPLAFYEQGGLYLYSPVKQALLASAGAILLFLFFADRWVTARRAAPSDVTEWLFAFFLAWMGLAGFFATNGWAALMAWLQWAAGVTAFALIRRSAYREAALGALLLGAALTAIVGYAQAGGYGPPPAPDQYGETLLTATFGHANYAAQAAMPGVIAGFALVLASRSVVIGAAGAALAALCAPYLLMTESRGAWVATAFGVLLLLLLALKPAWGLRKRAGALAAVLIAAAALTLALKPGIPAKLQNALDTESQSTAVRLAIWEDSFPLIFKVPTLGFGPNQFLYHFPTYWSEETAKRVFAGGPHLVENPHNDWLALALDGGLPAVVFLGAGIVLLFFCRWRGVWALRRPEEAPFAAAAVAVSWAAYGMIDYPLHNPVPLLGFFAALGVMAPLVPSDDPGTRRGKAVALVLALAAAGLAYVAVPDALRAIPGQALTLKASQYLTVDPEESFRLALEAVELDEHNPLTFAVLGQAKLAMKPAPGGRVDYESAEVFLREALTRFPDDFTARYNLGVALYERAIDRELSFDKARVEFLKVIGINPYYGKAYFQLASIAARDQDGWPQVRRQLDRAIKLEPPLLFSAAQAPEFAPYRAAPGWAPWFDNLQQKLNIRRTR